MGTHTESQIVEIGKDAWRSSNLSFENLQGWRLRNVSGKPVLLCFVLLITTL